MYNLLFLKYPDAMSNLSIITHISKYIITRFFLLTRVSQPVVHHKIHVCHTNRIMHIDNTQMQQRHNKCNQTPVTPAINDFLYAIHRRTPSGTLATTRSLLIPVSSLSTSCARSRHPRTSLFHVRLHILLS